MQKYTVREKQNEISKELENYSPLLQDLLLFRDIKTREQAEKFLEPDYEKDLHDPFALLDMEKAVSRILQSIDNNETILIYSDYDADGIPGSVTLSDFFHKIGFTNFINYIPHRHDEGYGLHIEAVESFVEKGVKLIITIDCGIVDNDQVDKAQSLGMDVIITDHHEPGSSLPKAFAILNPKREDCSYPEKILCGSGVVFKLIQGILARRDFGLKAGFEKWFLDMVGLATLSDMVPLTGENRALAYYGLKVLRKSPRPGLQKLLQILKINQAHINEDDIGFMVTPRINVASRMDHPMDAFHLLSMKDSAKACASAEYLNKINDERKGLVASIVKEIKKRLEAVDLEEKPIIFMGSTHWRPGVLGLAANTIAENYNRPVFLWGRNGDETIKGSCRSDGVVNLVDLMTKAKEVFAGFGGHKMAGGFSVMPESLHLAEEALIKGLKDSQIEDSVLSPVWIDKSLSIDDISWDIWRDIDQLAPFGIGNPKPTFIFEKAVPSLVKMFGKQSNHLEITFNTKNNKLIKAIGFFMKPEQFEVMPEAGKPLNLVANIEKSMFRNFPELRLRIVDII